MRKKIIVGVLCLTCGFIGAWIAKFFAAADALEFRDFANETALARLQSSACRAYWERKDAVASFALSQYIDFLQFVGEARVGYEGQTADELSRAYVRLSFVDRALDQAEKKNEHFQKGLLFAKKGLTLKEMLPSTIEEFVHDLDAKKIP